MTGQVIEVTQPGHWLKKSRGFLQVSSKDGENLGQIPLDDIGVVIISIPGCSISTVLMDYLCRRNIPLVICGENYLPVSFTLPVQGHSRQFQTMQSQINMSEPRRKRAWKHIVQAKIKNQAEVLSSANKENKQLLRLVKKVRSGDPDNCEAQAARAYWQRLFGSDFRRDRNKTGLNSALNYIYAIVRACVARGISGAGLHPSFSIRHKNAQNPLNLVEDLFEPFRPVADYVLWHYKMENVGELTPEVKSRLAKVTMLTVPLENETSPLSYASVKTCRSFANYCLRETDSLILPVLPSPLDLSVL